MLAGIDGRRSTQLAGCIQAWSDHLGIGRISSSLGAANLGKRAPLIRKLFHRFPSRLDLWSDPPGNLTEMLRRWKGRGEAGKRELALLAAGHNLNGLSDGQGRMMTTELYTVTPRNTGCQGTKKFYLLLADFHYCQYKKQKEMTLSVKSLAFVNSRFSSLSGPV